MNTLINSCIMYKLLQLIIMNINFGFKLKILVIIFINNAEL